MQALIEKNKRLEAELEVQRHDSAPRIKDLEQEVHNLKVEKRLSALKSEGQTVQVAVSTGPSDPHLRAEIAAKDAQLSALVRMIKVYRKIYYYSIPAELRQAATEIESQIDTVSDDMPSDLIPVLQDLDREVIAEKLRADQEYQSEEEPTTQASVTNTDKSADHGAQHERESLIVKSNRNQRPRCQRILNWINLLGMRLKGRQRPRDQ